MGSDAIDPGVLDSNLFSKEFALLYQALILRRQAHAAGVMASCHPSCLYD